MTSSGAASPTPASRRPCPARCRLASAAVSRTTASPRTRPTWPGAPRMAQRAAPTPAIAATPTSLPPAQRPPERPGPGTGTGTGRKTGKDLRTNAASCDPGAAGRGQTVRSLRPVPVPKACDRIQVARPSARHAQAQRCAIQTGPGLFNDGVTGHVRRGPALPTGTRHRCHGTPPPVIRKRTGNRVPEVSQAARADVRPVTRPARRSRRHPPRRRPLRVPPPGRPASTWPRRRPRCR